MIQKPTLDAINYFIDQEIEHYELESKEESNEVIAAFYKGQLTALKYARHTVNLPWKDENESELLGTELSNIQIHKERGEL